MINNVIKINKNAEILNYSGPFAHLLNNSKTSTLVPGTWHK